MYKSYKIFPEICIVVVAVRILSAIPPQAFDVIIVGGGPVGALMGCLTASQGLAVAIIDKVAPSVSLQAAFDGRTTSIAYGSSLILQEAGVWPYLESHAHPIHHIHVADSKGTGFLTFNGAAVGDNPLGYMIENRFLRHALLQRCRDLPTLVYKAPETIVSTTQDHFKAHVFLQGDETLEAPLLISAEGRVSALRDKAGIPCRTWRYNQSCLVFVATHEHPHQSTAYENFHPNGPFATLPMDSHRSAIVWTEKQSLAQDIYDLEEAKFNKEMNRRFEALGRLSLEGQKWIYPLSGLLAKSLVGQRLALVGDAGHAIHPVAGQGMNLGIRDAKTLSELLVSAKKLGGDLGSQTLLQTYSRKRRLDNASMAGMSHGLIRLFSNDNEPLRRIRSGGLSIVNRIPFIKKRITHHAMGL